MYDLLKRNTLIVRYYCSEELRGEILISKYPDSTVSLDMKTKACSTKIYDKKNNSWTVKAADGKKYVTYEDPVKSIELEFRNDSLIWKLIRYQKRNRVDSTCMFNYEKNESSKEIYKYNKHGDIVYSETREYTRGDTKITKVTTSFIYDKKGNWIKKRVHNDSFPKTDLTSKSAYLRTLIY